MSIASLQPSNPLGLKQALAGQPFGRPGRALNVSPVGGTARAPQIGSPTGNVAAARYKQTQTARAGMGIVQSALTK